MGKCPRINSLTSTTPTSQPILFCLFGRTCRSSSFVSRAVTFYSRVEFPWLHIFRFHFGKLLNVNQPLRIREFSWDFPTLSSLISCLSLTLSKKEEKYNYGQTPPEASQDPQFMLLRGWVFSFPFQFPFLFLSGFWGFVFSPIISLFLAHHLFWVILLFLGFWEVSSIAWEFINMTEQEEDLIYRMYKLVGDR